MKPISLAELKKMGPRVISIVLIVAVILKLFSLTHKINQLEGVVRNQEQTLQKLAAALEELSATAETTNEHLHQLDKSITELANKQASIRRDVEELTDSVSRPVKLPPNSSPQMQRIAKVLPPLTKDCGVYDGEGFPLKHVPIVAIGYFESENKKTSYIVVTNNEWYFTSPSFWKKQEGGESAFSYAGKIVLTCSGEWPAYFMAHEILDRLSYVAYSLQTTGELIVKGIIIIPHSNEEMKWRKWLGTNREIIEEATQKIK
jgi:cell division protein FtsB